MKTFGAASACVNVNGVRELIGLLAASHTDATSRHVELTSALLSCMRQGIHTDNNYAKGFPCTVIIMTTLVQCTDGSDMNRWWGPCQPA